MSLRSWSRILCTVAVLMLTMQVAATQKSANAGPKYDFATEAKIKGVVEEVREVPGDLGGTELVIKTDTATVLVHVAPADFLKEMDTSFNKGDQVEVVGAKVPNAQDELLAREITVGTNVTTLRDDKGIPVWTGWKPTSSGK